MNTYDQSLSKVLDKSETVELSKADFEKLKVSIINSELERLALIADSRTDGWYSLTSDEIRSLKHEQKLDCDGVLPDDVKYHKLDNAVQVFFYEQDFYVLSNFSSFTLQWKGLRFDTSEAVYHWEKFPDDKDLQNRIQGAHSAHAAYKIAERFKSERRSDWDSVKVDIMYGILRRKAEQHEYVRRKLLATGTRELIEDSWRDDFWGWGPNRDGQNMLGKLWMKVRSELQTRG